MWTLLRIVKSVLIRDNLCGVRYLHCILLKSVLHFGESTLIGVPVMQAVYGVLSSIEGLQAFTDLMKHTNMAAWYWPMKQLVDKEDKSL